MFHKLARDLKEKARVGAGARLAATAAAAFAPLLAAFMLCTPYGVQPPPWLRPHAQPPSRAESSQTQVLPIELPGRNTRVREPPETDLRHLARQIADVVAACCR